MTARIHPGVVSALAAAALFGASAPLAKLLLDRTDPWLLAALLYLGSGAGLWLLRLWRRPPAFTLERTERIWLALAVACGGIVGPVLLLVGLKHMAASSASLLLNAEGLLTAVLAWVVWRENMDRRVLLGMLAIVAGGVVLAWGSSFAQNAAATTAVWPAIAIVGACLAWAIDNNLMRKVSLADATWLAMIRGLVAGSVNLVLALWIADASWPGAGTICLAALLGFASYGASLALFVVALRELGVARTGAYFSVAPFFGATLAVLLLAEPVTWQLLGAGALMAVGVALHVLERHEHQHKHEAMLHSHAHTHGVGDEHHDHRHEEAVPPGTRHAHPHGHEPLVHTHPHYPDAHHRHPHQPDR
ncbi:MAG: EamA family transporter [Burkholderiales bacterium]